MSGVPTHDLSAAIKPQSTAPLASILAAAQQRHALFPAPAPAGNARPQPVVVAVSGGVDSVVLLHLLAHLAAAWKLELHVAHVDHALRPASAEDAAFVRDLAGAFGLPIHSVRLDGAALHADPAGVEAAARTARYRFLCATAINVTPSSLVPLVAVAHHADDQAETLLLRLVQGSGLAGLAAMRPVTLLEGTGLGDPAVRLVRPLLAAPRAAILDYAQRNRLAWREDESNTDDARARNLLRHEVLPHLARLNPDIRATLARTATLLADETDRLHASDAATCRQLTVAAGNGRLLLDLAGVQALPQADRRGLLRAALGQLRDELRAVTFAQLDGLAAAIAAAGSGSGPHPLPHDLAWSIVWGNSDQGLCLALHRRDTLPVEPPGPWLSPAWRAASAAAKLDPEQPCTMTSGEWMLTCNTVPVAALSLPWGDNPDRWLARFDRALLLAPELTTARPGMRIAPLGMGGRHKQVGDLFTDRKIAPALREGWPVVVDRASDTVLWVCGLAQSHYARITGATQRVWVVRWAHSAG